MILRRVQIIRDNLISPLNHCDLSAVSVACSAPLGSFNHFLLFQFSLLRSLSGALAPPLPLGEFKCSRRPLAPCLPSSSSSSSCFLPAPAPVAANHRRETRKNYCALIKLSSRSEDGHTLQSALITGLPHRANNPIQCVFRNVHITLLCFSP